MNEGSDNKSDSALPMNGQGHPDPAQSGAELKKEQDEIRNSEDENDGNSIDFHDRIPPFFTNETQKAQRVEPQKSFRVGLFFAQNFCHCFPRTSVHVTICFGLYLYLALYLVLDLLAKSGSFGPVGRAVIPTGNFLIISLDP